MDPWAPGTHATGNENLAGPRECEAPLRLQGFFFICKAGIINPIWLPEVVMTHVPIDPSYSGLTFKAGLGDILRTVWKTEGRGLSQRLGISLVQKSTERFMNLCDKASN